MLPGMFLCRVLSGDGTRVFKLECDWCGVTFEAGLQTYRNHCAGMGHGRFCSISCGTKGRLVNCTCVICGHEFTWSTKKKTCSVKCLDEHYKRKSRANREKKKQTYNCKRCGKEFRRLPRRLGAGFCGRSCAAKHNIENGLFEEFRLRVNEKKGEERPCCICATLTYVAPRHLDDLSFNVYCRAECGREGLRRWMIENNPIRGTKMSDEAKQRQRKTLFDNHGVTNAGLLIKGPSRGQRELRDLLDEKYGDAGLETFMPDVVMQPDITLEKMMKIVEYNGTYWHADRRFYKSDKTIGTNKLRTAAEIRERDAKRIETFNNEGYCVFVMWEHDFTKDKDCALKKLFEWIESSACVNETSSEKNPVKRDASI